MDFSLSRRPAGDRGSREADPSATWPRNERQRELETERRAALRPRAVEDARRGGAARHGGARGARRRGPRLPRAGGDPRAGRPPHGAGPDPRDRGARRAAARRVRQRGAAGSLAAARRARRGGADGGARRRCAGAAPRATATAGGSRGVRLCVPAAEIADAMLVPAQGPSVASASSWSSRARRASRSSALATTSGQPESRVDLRRACASAPRRSSGARARATSCVEWITLRATLGALHGDARLPASPRSS